MGNLTLNPTPSRATPGLKRESYHWHGNLELESENIYLIMDGTTRMGLTIMSLAALIGTDSLHSSHVDSSTRH